ncbi:MAG: hypothetical protein B6I18_08145 [Bacteroidetes bacterium 4572_112]|nr:MAG: hypothetical protein B6I18_08145 [Bacteroidetes bacterium 4572_112]
MITSVKSKRYRIAAEVLYNYRAEEFSDRLLLKTLFGLTSVENTELQMLIKYAFCLEDYKPEYLFNPRQEIFWSNNLDFGFNFNMRFLEQFEANAGYTLSIWGDNSWNYGIFNMKMSYHF